MTLLLITSYLALLWLTLAFFAGAKIVSEDDERAWTSTPAPHAQLELPLIMPPASVGG